MKVSPSPACGCSSCTAVSTVRRGWCWFPKHIVPQARRANSPAAPSPTGPVLVRQAHHCGKPEITGPASWHLLSWTQGCREQNAQEPIPRRPFLMRISSVPHSGHPSEAPGQAQPCTASVLGRKGTAAPGRAAQHYVGVTGLTAFAASLRQPGTYAAGSFGAMGPRADPATTALLPGRGQPPCGSHQPQLQQCFPEGWVICLPCFACLRLPQGQGNEGSAARLVWGAQQWPPTQGRTGRGAKPPPLQHTEHPTALHVWRKGGGGCGDGSGHGLWEAALLCFTLSAIPGNKQLEGPL